MNHDLHCFIKFFFLFSIRFLSLNVVRGRHLHFAALGGRGFGLSPSPCPAGAPLDGRRVSTDDLDVLRSTVLLALARGRQTRSIAVSVCLSWRYSHPWCQQSQAIGGVTRFFCNCGPHCLESAQNNAMLVTRMAAAVTATMTLANSQPPPSCFLSDAWSSPPLPPQVAGRRIIWRRMCKISRPQN